MHIDQTSIPVLAEISRDFVMLTGGSTVAYHIASGDQIAKEGFVQYCSKHYGDVALIDNEGAVRPMASGECWWNWKDASKRVVRRIVMEPTHEEENAFGQDRTVFNRWHLLKLEMATPDYSAGLEQIAPFIDHLRYISDNDSRGVLYFLNWLAWLYQHPEDKIPTAIMLYSKWTQIGKTMIGKLLRAVFGASLVKSVDGLRLHSNFMDAFEHKRIAVLNELARSDKQDSYERFKSLVSEEQMEFEGKGRASKEVKNFLHFIITTNNADALPLMEGDSRVLVLRCEAPRRPDEYYQNFGAWIKGPGPSLVAGAFANWVFPADWDYKAPVPQTDAVKRTQRDVRGGLADFITELIASEKAPFDKDMGRHSILVEQMNLLYPANMRMLKANHKTMPAALAAIGAEQIQTNYKSKKGTTICAQVWCWRNKDKWREASGEDRAAHFEN